MNVLLGLNTGTVEIQAFNFATHYVIYSKIKFAYFIKKFIIPKRAHSTYSRKTVAFITFPCLKNM